MHGRPENDMDEKQPKWNGCFKVNALGSNSDPPAPKQNTLHFSPRQLRNLSGCSGDYWLTAKVLGRVSLVALPSDSARSALRPESA
jgi:hypothetical protein